MGCHRAGPAQSGGWQGRGSTFSGSCNFLGETGYDAAGSIVLVQSVGQLLAGCLQLLAQSEAVQHDCVLGKGNATVRGWEGAGSTRWKSQPLTKSILPRIPPAWTGISNLRGPGGAGSVLAAARELPPHTKHWVQGALGAHSFPPHLLQFPGQSQHQAVTSPKGEE